MALDSLFAHIERLQGDRPWGRVLDAGTGSHSLAWIAGLTTESSTAVTGELGRARGLEREFSSRLRPRDRIVVGNWTDPLLLHCEVFDVVLADYLLGAVDGFAPYFQDRLFTRLRPHVGGRLYVVGLEPYPDSTDSPAGRIVLEIARLVNACILLAGHRMFREYPLEWVLRSLDASGYVVEDAKSFPIVRGMKFVEEQLDVCQRKLPHIEPSLSRELARTMAKLRDRALTQCGVERGLRFGEDYVVAARSVGDASLVRFPVLKLSGSGP